MQSGEYTEEKRSGVKNIFIYMLKCKKLFPSISCAFLLYELCFIQAKDIKQTNIMPYKHNI